MDQKHKGAKNEHIAIAWLLSEGYEVFRNVSQHGPIDVIAVKGTEGPLYLDVKSNVTTTTLHDEQYRLEVKLLTVSDGVCSIREPLDRRKPAVTCEVCQTLFFPKGNNSGQAKYCGAKCKHKAEYQQAKAAGRDGASYRRKKREHSLSLKHENEHDRTTGDQR